MLRLKKMRGNLKGIFFLLRLHKILPSGTLEFAANMARLSKWINEHANSGFSDYYTATLDNSRREQLYGEILEKENLNTGVDYLEFGVSRGVSFRWWVNHLTNENSRFYGFDTFDGLPESWGNFKKGDMSNGCRPPEIDDTRVKFYQGLFQQTLNGFLKSYSPTKRRVIHMDADLYSATIYVLTTLAPYIQKGDILFFDEFNVPLHEFKAFMEWTSAFYINYEVLGSVNNCHQVAIKIA
jgi:hypothetical protein